MRCTRCSALCNLDEVDVDLADWLDHLRVLIAMVFSVGFRERLGKEKRGFPEMGIPPNHPFAQGIFPYVNHFSFGIPHLWKAPTNFSASNFSSRLQPARLCWSRRSPWVPPGTTKYVAGVVTVPSHGGFCGI